MDVPEASNRPIEHGFSPYVNNGGTVLGICGDDYCVLAGDTRLSLGYGICSRDVPKVFKLTDKCCIATSGMQADSMTLQKLLKFRLTEFQHQHGKPMPTPSIAQMLSNTLYYRRFFPYYTFNVVGGLDEQGKGCVYSYDAIGSFERLKFSASGTGQSLIEPFLDNQVNYLNHENQEAPKRTLAETVDLVKDTFASAGERDIYTGDAVTIYSITKEGTTVEIFDLKKD